MCKALMLYRFKNVMHIKYLWESCIYLNVKLIKAQQVVGLEAQHREHSDTEQRVE